MDYFPVSLERQLLNGTFFWNLGCFMALNGLTALRPTSCLNVSLYFNNLVCFSTFMKLTKIKK